MHYRHNMAEKIRPKKQVVAPVSAQKVLQGIFAGLVLLHDLQEEKRIERIRDIRYLCIAGFDPF